MHIRQSSPGFQQPIDPRLVKNTPQFHRPQSPVFNQPITFQPIEMTNTPPPQAGRLSMGPMSSNFISPSVTRNMPQQGPMPTQAPNQILRMEQINRSTSSSRIIHGTPNPRSSSQQNFYKKGESNPNMRSAIEYLNITGHLDYVNNNKDSQYSVGSGKLSMHSGQSNGHKLTHGNPKGPRSSIQQRVGQNGPIFHQQHQFQQQPQVRESASSEKYPIHYLHPHPQHQHQQHRSVEKPMSASKSSPSPPPNLINVEHRAQHSNLRPNTTHLNSNHNIVPPHYQGNLQQHQNIQQPSPQPTRVVSTQKTKVYKSYEEYQQESQRQLHSNTQQQQPLLDSQSLTIVEHRKSFMDMGASLEDADINRQRGSSSGSHHQQQGRSGSSYLKPDEVVMNSHNSQQNSSLSSQQQQHSYVSGRSPSNSHSHNSNINNSNNKQPQSNMSSHSRRNSGHLSSHSGHPELEHSAEQLSHHSKMNDESGPNFNDDSNTTPIDNIPGTPPTHSRTYGATSTNINQPVYNTITKTNTTNANNPFQFQQQQQQQQPLNKNTLPTNIIDYSTAISKNRQEKPPNAYSLTKVTEELMRNINSNFSVIREQTLEYSDDRGRMSSIKTNNSNNNNVVLVGSSSGGPNSIQTAQNILNPPQGFLQPNINTTSNANMNSNNVPNLSSSRSVNLLVNNSQSAPYPYPRQYSPRQHPAPLQQPSAPFYSQKVIHQQVQENDEEMESTYVEDYRTIVNNIYMRELQEGLRRINQVYTRNNHYH